MSVRLQDRPDACVCMCVCARACVPILTFESDEQFLCNLVLRHEVLRGCEERNDTSAIGSRALK